MCERYTCSAHLIMWPHPARSWQQTKSRSRIKESVGKKLVLHICFLFFFIQALKPWPTRWSMYMWCTLQRSVKPGICFSVCVQMSLPWLIFKGLVGSVSVECLSAPLTAQSIVGSAWGQIWDPYCICTQTLLIPNFWTVLTLPTFSWW